MDIKDRNKHNGTETSRNRLKQKQTNINGQKYTETDKKDINRHKRTETDRNIQKGKETKKDTDSNNQKQTESLAKFD